MKELLFEIGTEEIPAAMIPPAMSYLAQAMAEKLGQAGLAFGRIRSAATPRRLAVAVAELANRQADRREEVLGPAKKVGFDADGNPSRAALGFARSQGMAVEALRSKNTPKGEYLYVVKEVVGRETMALLPELLGELVRAIPFPKSMRWGNGSHAFVRPIQWLLCLYGGAVVPFALDKVVSAASTRGHRFMAPESFTVSGFDDYLAALRRRHVLADPQERRLAVAAEVQRAVLEREGDSGAMPSIDEGLLDTVSNLVEQPCGVCGTFADKFLEIPEEVLITSMREHQKYFPVRDASGRLMARFVAVNNTRVADPLLAAGGHERVLRARLEDAHFFFREDRKKRLAERAEQLSGIVFQNRLGTMLEKRRRIVALGGWLADRLAPEEKESVLRAADLAKADLLTEMVGEFPTLQGAMGREYALLEGETAAVATAIHEHYLPVRAGGELPRTMAGALVGLADRIDTIAGCFAIGLKPTGNTDPFGLRRLGIAVLHVIMGRELSLSLGQAFTFALEQYSDLAVKEENALAEILLFLQRRLENDLAAAGMAQDAIAAALSGGFDDANDCRARIMALMGIRERAEFGLLAGSFKRINNIVKENQDDLVDPALLQENAELELAKVLREVQEESVPLLAQHRYEAALEVMLRMKAPVDRFFDEIMVMVEDQGLRRNRLNLLTGLRRAVLALGDISCMSGAA